jgi:hypothetical protein
MFNSDILEVAVGIVFIFALISSICSAVRKGIEAWFKTRASYLEFGIRELLHDKQGTGLAKSLFNHPLIYGLFSGDYTPGAADARLSPWRGGRNLPSYIPSGNFALAIMDIAARGPQGFNDTATAGTPSLSLAQIRANITNLGNPRVQRALLTAIDTAQGDLDRARANIEAWYDSSMDRVSGWYRRSTHWVIFWIAFLLAVGLNVNSVSIADYLYRHDSVRSTIVSTIERTAADPAAQNPNYAAAKRELDDMHLPMGWTHGWGAPRARANRTSDINSSNADIPVLLWDDIFGPLVGWLVTAFAATLGAPFWFDILNKIMVIRSTVKPHEKSGEEGSEDRAAAPSVQPLPSAGATREALHESTGSNTDSCGIGDVAPTPDERLPAAQGGVA